LINSVQQLEIELPIDEKALLSYIQDVDGVATHKFAKALIHASMDVHDGALGDKILKQSSFISISEVSNHVGSFSQQSFNVDGNNITSFNTMGSYDEFDLVTHSQSLPV
jgi:hypothetical protein